MKNDPVLNRIWEARHAISMQCDHDPKKLVAYYLQRQKNHQKQLFSRSQTNTDSVGSAEIKISE